MSVFCSPAERAANYNRTNRTLGGGSTNDSKELILNHKLFTDIAKAHNCSPGVVSLSWAVQRGIGVIPKSASKTRIEENINLVTLTEDEMAAINGAQDTIKKHRLGKNIQSMRMDVEGKPTLMMWAWEDFGWEDEQGNWLT